MVSPCLFLSIYLCWSEPLSLFISLFLYLFLSIHLYLESHLQQQLPLHPYPSSITNLPLYLILHLPLPFFSIIRSLLFPFLLNMCQYDILCFLIYMINNIQNHISSIKKKGLPFLVPLNYGCGYYSVCGEQSTAVQ
jgi:hypothetical protein